MRKQASISTYLSVIKAVILVLTLNVSFIFLVQSQEENNNQTTESSTDPKSFGELQSDAIRAGLEGDYSNGLSILNKLLANGQLSDQQIVQITVLQRNFYFDLHSYAKAIEIHRTINWEEVPAHWESLVPNHFIALVNYETRNFNLALDVLKNSSKILSGAGYFENSFQSSLTLCKAYQNLRKVDSALFYLDQANSYLIQNALSDSSGSYAEELRFLRASLFYDQGDFLKAIPLFKADTSFYLHSQEFNEQVKDGTSSTLQLAAALIEIDQFDLAKSTLRRAEKLLLRFPNPEQYHILLRHRIKFYESTNQLNSAHALTKGYVAMWDILLQNRSLEKSQAQQIAFTAILEEERLAQANVQSKVIAEEEEKRYRLLILIAIVILVGVLVILLIYQFYHRLLKEKEKLAATSDELKVKSTELEKTLHEKELLVKEVHHRVKNNLQMISSLFFIQSKNVSDPIAKSVINEGQARVQAMASIHQKLYDSDTIDEIDMNSHFDSLCHQIISSYAPAEKKIDLHLDISNVNLNVDIALPLSLIVNELISNSIKHAFQDGDQGSIDIYLRSDGGKVELKYKDSGKSFDQSKIQTEGGIGLKLIQLLSSQLKANLQDDLKNGSFHMIIPLS